MIAVIEKTANISIIGSIDITTLIAKTGIATIADIIVIVTIADGIGIDCIDAIINMTAFVVKPAMIANPAIIVNLVISAKIANITTPAISANIEMFAMPANTAVLANAAIPANSIKTANDSYNAIIACSFIIAVSTNTGSTSITDVNDITSNIDQHPMIEIIGFIATLSIPAIHSMIAAIVITCNSFIIDIHAFISIIATIANN